MGVGWVVEEHSLKTCVLSSQLFAQLFHGDNALGSNAQQVLEYLQFSESCAYFCPVGFAAWQPDLSDGAQVGFHGLGLFQGASLQVKLLRQSIFRDVCKEIFHADTVLLNDAFGCKLFAEYAAGIFAQQLLGVFLVTDGGTRSYWGKFVLWQIQF